LTVRSIIDGSPSTGVQGEQTWTSSHVVGDHASSADTTFDMTERRVKRRSSLGQYIRPAPEGCLWLACASDSDAVSAGMRRVTFHKTYPRGFSDLLELGLCWVCSVPLEVLYAGHLDCTVPSHPQRSPCRSQFNGSDVSETIKLYSPRIISRIDS
jgi:hypothetical protein